MINLLNAAGLENKMKETCQSNRNVVMILTARSYLVSVKKDMSLSFNVSPYPKSNIGLIVMFKFKVLVPEHILIAQIYAQVKTRMLDL